jgi:hypothetical protein
MMDKAKITLTVNIIGGSWAALGFYRGVKMYNYNYGGKKHLEYEYIKNTNKPYLYSKTIENGGKRFLSGLMGTVFYLNPFFWFIYIPKEIYRLEVNIRGLEDEKKSTYYNEL